MSTVCRFLAAGPLACVVWTSALVGADPLTRHLDIDFGRDVASRNLTGLATRSDGCIVPGPALTELAGPAVGELLWTMEAANGSGQSWLVGTGPEGRIVEVTLKGTNYTMREVARVAEPQVFALNSLPGALYLIREGKTVARVVLPADSIFDVLLLPDIQPGAAPAAAAPGWMSG